MPGMIGTDANNDSLLQSSEMNSNLNLVITNTDSKTVVTTSLTPYLQKSASDTYTFGANDYAEFDGTPSSTTRVFQELKGNVLTIRENGTLTVKDKGVDGIAKNTDDGTARNYDRVLNLNVSSGAIVSETLIAHTQSDYDYAVAAGYTVVLEDTGSTSGISPVTMTTYAENVTNAGSSAVVVTNGNFSTDKISAADGSSLLRQEDDGTVHIGQNSIVLADELVSNSGYDQIYSSSGVLELGNTSSHRTIITGTLEIQDPTAPGHAATKRYADGIAALSNAIAIMPRAPEGKSMLTLGTGYLDGESALAIGVSSRPVDSDLTFNFATSYNKTVSTPAFAAGVGWEF